MLTGFLQSCSATEACIRIGLGVQEAGLLVLVGKPAAPGDRLRQV